MSAPGRFVSAVPAKVSSIPIFLAPAFLKPTQTVFPALVSSRTFSSSIAHSSSNRRSGEANKKRGESAIRRTGPRTTQGRWNFALPEPAFRERVAQPTDYLGTANHGLWQFFDSTKKSMVEPHVSAQHGRAWTREELSRKSFEDLHKLYWVCIKHKNQTLTLERERVRRRAGYGEAEAEERIAEIKKTMSRIRKVLADRQMAFEEAQTMLHNETLKEIFSSDGEKDEDNESWVEDSYDQAPIEQPRP
ncbi:hypothetical protein PV10_07232 [Exophiala mesophila]|uniref:Large ribosomal subunit protein uL29m n=1 Tax=Exophiala mesophila TaxID=212818 RepID=A0A0D1Z7E7_EXOME|nr:uncharacterized protein PV10_07232 [Exophiala mesophila]KIV89864.1 hypothetical protein PV10_07232 [Exophiala mesophila]